MKLVKNTWNRGLGGKILVGCGGLLSVLCLCSLVSVVVSPRSSTTPSAVQDTASRDATSVARQMATISAKRTEEPVAPPSTLVPTQEAQKVAEEVTQSPPVQPAPGQTVTYEDIVENNKNLTGVQWRAYTEQTQGKFADHWSGWVTDVSDSGGYHISVNMEGPGALNLDVVRVPVGKDTALKLKKKQQIVFSGQIKTIIDLLGIHIELINATLNSIGEGTVSSDANAAAPTTVAVAQPMPTPLPSPMPIQPIRMTGTGQQATSKFKLAQGLAVFQMTHNGSSNFAIKLLDSQGELVDLLVNEIGAFKGGKAEGIKTDGDYLLDITADGKWSVNIEQSRPDSAPALPNPLNGSGQQVSPLFNLKSGLATFKMEHTGTSNFAIKLLDQDGQLIDLLVNEVGDFNGSKATHIDQDGIYLLDITADGKWSISAEQ